MADNYLTTCVYLLNEVGGYWKIGFFGDPEKLIAEKSQEIKKVFDNKFRKQISKIFHCNSFFPVMEKSIIEPLFSAINERINNLSALEKELTYTPEIRQKKEDKEEATKDIYPNLSSDDIWKML